MDREVIINIEKLRGRKLSPQEKSLLHEVSTGLNIRDNDAVWALLAAMEYQRVFYEDMPDKIAGATKAITDNIADAAKKQMALAQADLTKIVVSEARYLATTIQFGQVIPLAIIALVCLFAYSALCMWAGFQLGAREVRGLYQVLLMPWAPLACLACSITGLVYFFFAVIKIHKGEDYASLHCIASLIIMIGGLVLIYFVADAAWPRNIFYHLK